MTTFKSRTAFGLEILFIHRDIVIRDEILLDGFVKSDKERNCNLIQLLICFIIMYSVSLLMNFVITVRLNYDIKIKILC